MSKTKKPKADGSKTFQNAGVEPDELPDGFVRDDGLIFYQQVRKDGAVVNVPLCVDFTVEGQLSDERDTSPAKLIAFKTRRGRKKTLVIPDWIVAADLWGLRRLLAENQFHVVPSKGSNDKLVQLLTHYTSPTWIETFSRPGFHGVGSDNAVWANPLGDIVRASLENKNKYKLNDATLLKKSEKGGSLDQWMEAAAEVVRHPAMPHVAMGICAGAAGMILNLLEEETRGLAFGGPSTRGKTLAQLAQVSMHSTLAEGGLLHNARTTGNGLESALAEGTGATVAIDELKAGHKQLASEIAMLGAGGRSKRRSRTDGEVRRQKTWCTFYTVSSEKSISTLVALNGEAQIAGQTRRLPSVDVTDVPQLDAKEAEMAEALKIKFKHNYGWAGAVVAQQLFREGYHKHPEKLRERLEAVREKLAPDETDSVRISCSRVFALLQTAGEICLDAGLFPGATLEDVERVARWGWESFCGTPEAQTTDPGADAEIQLKTWLISNFGGRVRSWDTPDRQEAWVFYKEGIVYIPTANFHKIPLPIGVSAVIKQLAADGLLEPHDKGYTHQYGLFGLRHYRIRFNLDNASEPAAEAQGTAGGREPRREGFPSIKQAGKTFDPNKAPGGGRSRFGKFH